MTTYYFCDITFMTEMRNHYERCFIYFTDHGNILAAIGQAQLFRRKRFNQFKELIELHKVCGNNQCNRLIMLVLIFLSCVISQFCCNPRSCIL